MNTKPLMLAVTSAVVLSCGPAALPVLAQLPASPVLAVYQPLSDQQLDQLLGPVALYPDPLLAQILAAATQPTQIVPADRYLAAGGDPTRVDEQPWDSSVQALARYPSVLQYLDANLGWTTAVGQAFINQPSEVMESIQRLRWSARNFGNLPSTPEEQIVEDGGDLEILPADPDEIYLPIYQTATVYCQGGYPPAFGFVCTPGPWLDCGFDWPAHRLVHWRHEGNRPSGWRHASGGERAAQMGQTSVWQPQDRRGSGWPAERRPNREPSFSRQTTAAPLINRPAEFHFGAVPTVIGRDHSRSAAGFGNANAQNPRTVVQFQAPHPAAVSHPAASFGGSGGGAHGGGSSDRR